VKVVACSTAQAGTVSYMKTPNALGVTIPPAISPAPTRWSS